MNQSWRRKSSPSKPSRLEETQILDQFMINPWSSKFLLTPKIDVCFCRESSLSASMSRCFLLDEERFQKLLSKPNEDNFWKSESQTLTCVYFLKWWPLIIKIVTFEVIVWGADKTIIKNTTGDSKKHFLHFIFMQSIYLNYYLKSSKVSLECFWQWDLKALLMEAQTALPFSWKFE